MFGPVRITIWAVPVSNWVLLGTNWRSGRSRSTTGWRPPLIIREVLSVILGRQYVRCRASQAKFRKTSRIAIECESACSCWLWAATCIRSSWNRSYSRSCERSSACRILDSISLSSGVTKRSPVEMVCLRIYSSGTRCRLVLVTSI